MSRSKRVMEQRVAEFYRSNKLWRTSFFLPEHREGTIQGRLTSLAEQLSTPSETKREEMEHILAKAMRNQEEIRIRLQDGIWLSAIPVTVIAGRLYTLVNGEDREIRLSEIMDAQE
ncbi:hypothetical protein GJ688_15510 [Heliobacillus mobilis]|uniref:YolD-like protein n=1 Tax=Heliobacterium mobile TaxID=28064 RepID=A0A6I3SNR8_HELMO|nr:hypothetical protein [Heliobacterium mobile]MTV50376.1 hypothetical protein [Heliobacterium mobile]